MAARNWEESERIRFSRTWPPDLGSLEQEKGQRQHEIGRNQQGSGLPELAAEARKRMAARNQETGRKS